MCNKFINELNDNVYGGIMLMSFKARGIDFIKKIEVHDYELFDNNTSITITGADDSTIILDLTEIKVEESGEGEEREYSFIDKNWRADISFI